MLTTRQAMKALGIKTRETIYNMVKRGQLKGRAMKQGRNGGKPAFMFWEEDVEEYRQTTQRRATQSTSPSASAMATATEVQGPNQ